MNVSKDFEELFAFFNARKVKALIVGGFAVAFHAKPRFTKDIDLWIEPTPDNAARLLAALADFGFGSLSLTVEDFIHPGRIVQLGHPPNRVDLMTSVQGLEFEEAWENRVEGRYGDETVFYLGKADLMRNKELVARPQDRADLEWLKSSPPKENR
ncbi:MAG: DUF6036 family nucleotidyltransferase [Thermoanaerobaculia bacterium]